MAASTTARLAQATPAGYGWTASVSNSWCGGRRPDCHHMRMAISAKPIGMIASTTQSGTPPESCVIDCRSASTAPKAAHASTAATVQPTADATRSAYEPHPRRHERRRRQREVAAIAGGNHAADERHPERQVLHPGDRARHALPEEAAAHDLRNRQHRHRQEDDDGDAVLEAVEQAGGERRPRNCCGRDLGRLRGHRRLLSVATSSSFRAWPAWPAPS